MEATGQQITRTAKTKGILAWDQSGTVRAVVCDVVVKACPGNGRERVHWIGPVVPDHDVQAHALDVLIPVVDAVCQGVGVIPPSFEVSAANLGAASAHDLGVRVTGFSIDLPLVVAMLLAGLGIEGPQNITYTGHVASLDGHLRQVRFLAEKAEAAARATGVTALVHASLDDDSLDVLLSGEKARGRAALTQSVRSLRTTAASHLAEVLGSVLTDEAIIRGGLRAGFFGYGRDEAEPAQSNIALCIRILSADARERFLNVLRAQLSEGRCSDAQGTLVEWAHFHASRGQYPAGGGAALLQTVRSIPLGVLRIHIRSQLLAEHLCLQLGQLATPADFHDLQLLYGAVMCPWDGGSGQLKRPSRGRPGKAQVAEADCGLLLNTVLSEISAAGTAVRVGIPLDSARASFALDTSVAETREQLLEVVSAFHHHLLRHTEGLPCSVPLEAAGPEGLALLQQAFPGEDGIDAAFAEATSGVKGGLRLILDLMTARQKELAQENHIARVLAEAVDTLDWDGRVDLARVVLARSEPLFSAEAPLSSPEQCARRLKGLLRTFAESLDRVSEMFRRL